MINVCIKSIDLGTGELRYPTNRFFYVGHDIVNNPPLQIGEVLALDNDHAHELLDARGGVLEVTTQDATRVYSRKSNGGAAPDPTDADLDEHEARVNAVVEAMQKVEKIPQNLTRQGYPNLKSVRAIMGEEVHPSDYRSALASYRRG